MISFLLGVVSIEPYLGEGGVRLEGCINPPPPAERATTK